MTKKYTWFSPAFLHFKKKLKNLGNYNGTEEKPAKIRQLKKKLNREEMDQKNYDNFFIIITWFSHPFCILIIKGPAFSFLWSNGYQTSLLIL